ncbi:AAA domain-containing protein [Mesoplasma seiffertii]|uniref:AAA domain-containing protein n=1 Tax=Mesoplasma seiffertii TaxID=28224 RepID=UPI00047B872B|nr:AAA domain-containing protein [Mesoplasma seiffertii]
MESKALIKEFKTRLLSTNRRGSIYYNSFIKRSNTINLFKFQKFELILNGKSLKNSLRENLINIDFRITKAEPDSKEFIKINSYAKELKTIISKNKLLISERNQDCFYIGKYFIEGMISKNDKDYFRAPLFLQKVTIEKDNLKEFTFKIENDVIFNNALMNLLAQKNSIKWDFYEYNSEDFKSEELTRDTITKLLNAAGIKLVDESNFIADIFNNDYEDISSSSKVDEVAKFLEFKKVGLYAYPVKVVAIGLFDLAASNILAAYELIESDTAFFETLAGEEYNSLIKAQEATEKDIKTISVLDYSQKNAVLNALKESTFIFGPPGTGKSQTIVNLIANIIYKEKKSLFITEKKVASTVVYDKLNKLNEFTLMLHNNEKAKDVHQKVANLYYKIQKLIQDDKRLHVNFNKYDDEITEIFNKIKEYKVLMNTNDGNRYMSFLRDVYEVKRTDGIRKENTLSFEIKSDLDMIVKNEFWIDLNNLKNLLDLDYSYSNVWKSVIKQEASMSKFLFNKINYNNISSNISFFKKKKYKNYIKTQEFVELKQEIAAFAYKYEIENVMKLLSLIKTLTQNELSLSSFTVKEIFINHFEKMHEEKLTFINSNWSYKLQLLFKNKAEADLNGIYNRHINNIVKIVKNGQYNDVETNTVRSVATLFNRMGRNIESVRNHVRLTTWFKNYYPIIETMFPIILASPETIANHKLLPIDKGEFDYCIFDEASQIFTEKCLPAMYRAEKYIISGDDKQLSPSNFFQSRTNIENDVDDEVSNFEEDIVNFSNQTSLIDFAKGKYRKFMLSFHYRSKFEELIQFSNHKYYEGNLNVISDPTFESKPIEVINVDGQRINRINLVEADEVIKLLKKIVKKDSQKSIGIITFNSEQQKLIEDKVELLASQNVDIYNIYNLKEHGESLFIKNIENVQGDERDIIIFSIGFAEDENGNFRNNFGPINIEGGERRLNVAITRAKEKMYVVKSINSERMNPSPNSVGAVHFKQFLEYCEKLQKPAGLYSDEVQVLLKNQTEVIKNTFDQIEFDSHFEEEVYDAIIKILPPELSLKTQVECSGFKIDQAIYHSELNKYILAIECDGWSYHSSEYQRQRDVERQIFLENRGWRFKRILSTQWWNKNSLIKESFIDSIKMEISEYLKTIN